MLMENLFTTSKNKSKDRYCRTIPNNDLDIANKYLLVHNHRKDEFAPFHSQIINKRQSKLSFYGFQTLQSMQKNIKYRYNFDEETRLNMVNKKRNDYKLQIVEERINNLESRNAELEQSNRLFFAVFNEVMKSKINKDKYITRNLNKFNDKDKENINKMLQFANDPNNEFDDEGRLLEYRIPGILEQLKKDIAKLVAENSFNNNKSSVVFNNSIDKLKKDIYKDIDHISNKQIEHMNLLKQFVNYNSVDKQLAKRMMKIQSNDEQSPIATIEEDNENEENDNNVISHSIKRRKKKAKTNDQINMENQGSEVYNRRKKKSKTLSLVV